MTRHVSDEGLALIKSFEGFCSKPYQDSVGVWTIGFGETQRVGPRSRPVTEQQAAAKLRARVNRDYAPHVADLKLGLSQRQFDALVSFVYNLGPGAIGPDTGVGRELRRHHFAKAANHILDWDKAGGRRLEGLTRRRRAERKLFLRGSDLRTRARAALRR
jgi:lysozyme